MQRDAAQRRPDLILHAGDLAYAGTGANIEVPLPCMRSHARVHG
jgi:phosphodiesterase/alkaline phosphatase D-like protein